MHGLWQYCYGSVLSVYYKSRSGTHGLNEELGKHRGKEGRSQCMLCDDDRDSVAHVLWECPAFLWKSFCIYYIGSQFLSLDIV